MQTTLFEIPAIQKPFKHKARGNIYTDKIWNELDIHTKINIKVAYGYGDDLKPNYLIINQVFECGLDMYCLTNKESKHKGFMCYWDAPPEIKPI
jgi:hypothetical protein